MQINRLIIGFCIIIWGPLFCACRKDFLNVSPDKSLTEPETIQDFQALMNNNNFFESNPNLQEVSSDNYYTNYSTLESQFYTTLNCYDWASNTYNGGPGEGVTEWNIPYGSIYVTNVVLQYLPNLASTSSTQAAWNSIEGQALFYRAFNYYLLAQLFAVPYNPSTAAIDLGLPLRLTPNLDVSVKRSTVMDTYTRIVQDLLQAGQLLPAAVPSFNLLTRPTKPAVFGLLARTYLAMQDYQDALKYADSCLQTDSALLDYNIVSTTSSPTYNFPINNPEVVFQCYGNYYPILGSTSIVDSVLYASYDTNDLRKSVFFRLSRNKVDHYFRGSYTSGSDEFFGVASDEMYLIRAECNARVGNADTAMRDLNTLLLKRWRTGTFSLLTAISASDALKQVLSERRKELCFRGHRWTDLRRLNQDPNFAVTLIRVENGVTYSLPPNDLRYTLLLPLDEVQLGGIEQNQR